jgi:FkbM family methyltransferase
MNLAIMNYLALSPKGARAWLTLYSAYARALVAKALRPDAFITIGQYLNRDVTLTYRGLTLYARKHSEDLGYYAHTTKPSTFQWFRPHPGDIVVDCGSSVGLFTLLALKQGSTVYAFEPNTPTFTVLQRNVQSNGLRQKAHLYNVGLADRSGEMTLYAPEHFSGTTSLRKEWSKAALKPNDSINAIGVPITTLDEVLESEHRISWLLIDVESFEYELLLGARETLLKTERLIIEISKGNEGRVKQVIDKAGFREIARGPVEEAVQYYMYKRH